MRPLLLVLIVLGDAGRATVASWFELLEATTPEALASALDDHGADVLGVLTNGAVGIDAATIARLPALKLIGALGAGYENIALEAARARGIVVTNGAGTNDDCVADHAFALLLAAVRRIPFLDLATRRGVWRDALPLQPNFSGKRLGIVGLGNIGRKVARRAGGFDLEIGYHNRSKRPDTDDRYFETLLDLATWADYLVVCTPGGAATHHLVDTAVLEALGPNGYLVNVARGSVVDTAALAAALDRGVVAGAGLDVYEGEPAPPRLLTGSPRVVLTPHVGGRSPEAVANSVDLFVRNATLRFAGEPVLTPL